MVLRNSLLSGVILISCTSWQNEGPELAPLPKPGEVGIVFNIDLVDPKITARHWQAADGWAKYIRVSIGMDMEGYTPDANRPEYKRLKTLAKECARRGIGMHVILGGLPHRDANAWQNLTKEPNYQGQKYGDLPRAWLNNYLAWQDRAASEVVKAYGANAKNKIRFQLFNEPYDRGEDEAVTRMLNAVVTRVLGPDGKVHGCPLDGPALWGQAPQMRKQILLWKSLMQKYPDTLGRVDRIPLNVYPEGGTHRSLAELRSAYVRNAKTMYDFATKNFSRPVYFAEFGVSRVWDSRPDVFGAKTNEIAGKVLLDTLGEMRKYVPQITLYQSQDTSIENQKREGSGLMDASGTPIVDFAELRRIAN